MKTARQIAFEILNRVYTAQAYSNLALDAALETEPLCEQEKALASRLVYGVLERTITLDDQLQRYLTKPLKKLRPQALVILRLGAYQLLYMEKIPVSAAVNESVKLAKQHCAYAAGLVNAVLRKTAANGLCLPPASDAIQRGIVEYSCPEWILRRWAADYGEETALRLAESSVGGAPTVLRVNTLKTTRGELLEVLRAEGLDAQPHEMLADAVLLRNSGALQKLDAYRDGRFHVQDTASQLCCMALDAQPGERVLDLCAAPGGKSFTLAEQMQDTGELTACDLHAHRLRLIESGARRLGLRIVKTAQNDACVFNPAFPLFDKILCDVPCSGLGILRRKPEIRFKTPQEVDKLPKIQYSIMKTASKYLKPGGLMVYSTCTLNRQENESVWREFLEAHPDFEPAAVLPALQRYGAQTPYLTLMPHLHGSDGFFISAVRRRMEP